MATPMALGPLRSANRALGFALSWHGYRYHFWLKVMECEFVVSGFDTPYIALWVNDYWIKRIPWLVSYSWKVVRHVGFYAVLHLYSAAAHSF